MGGPSNGLYLVFPGKGQVDARFLPVGVYGLGLFPFRAGEVREPFGVVRNAKLNDRWDITRMDFLGFHEDPDRVIETALFPERYADFSDDIDKIGPVLKRFLELVQSFVIEAEVLVALAQLFMLVCQAAPDVRLKRFRRGLHDIHGPSD